MAEEALTAEHDQGQRAQGASLRVNVKRTDVMVGKAAASPQGGLEM